MAGKSEKVVGEMKAIKTVISAAERAMPNLSPVGRRFLMEKLRELFEEEET